MKKVNRVEEYCQTIFNSLGANVHNWGKPEYTRPLTRLFYVGVFDCGNPYPTGLISENALNNKSNNQKTVLDHYLSPQFIGRMILDNQEIYLKNYSKFRELFIKCTQTIIVTQKENFDLSNLTSNKKDDFSIKIPTNLKYNHLGIKLYKRDTNIKGWDKKDFTILETNLLNDVPVELLDYEKDFLVI